MKLRVFDFLLQSAEQYPDKIAVVWGETQLEYRELSTMSLAQAHWICSCNIEPGFRAAILTDNPIDYIVSYFAIQLAGGVAIGLNTQTSQRSLLEILEDSAPEIIFTGKKFHRFLPDFKVENLVSDEEPHDYLEACGAHFMRREATLTHGRDGENGSLPAVDATMMAQFIYTSGTTGKPKGVMLTHANLVANVGSVVQYLSLTAKDSIMAILPFFYSYGNSVMLTHMAVGGKLVVNQNFLYPNKILDEMVQHRVTGFSGVPSTFAILLQRSAVEKYSFPSLRYITQAGAPMAPKLAKQLSEIFPGVDIFIMYGQTEASARLAYLPAEDLQKKPASIGIPIPGVTLTLLDKHGDEVPAGEVGEIVANGPNVMAGYWNKVEETAKVLRKEGLWTGDLARRDEDGYFFIVSRKSDMIKSGSHRIAPKEIEDIYLENDAIAEVAIVGHKDSLLGEKIVACVVLKQGRECTSKELALHGRKNLPAFKVPHTFVLLQELPKTTTGKIKKADLSTFIPD